MFEQAIRDPMTDAFSLIDVPELGALSLPIYALEEVAKHYPGGVSLHERQINYNREYIFTEYMASKGAYSFLFETTEKVGLEERINMNLIATDRILARHILGI